MRPVPYRSRPGEEPGPAPRHLRVKLDWKLQMADRPRLPESPTVPWAVGSIKSIQYTSRHSLLHTTWQTPSMLWPPSHRSVLLNHSPLPCLLSRPPPFTTVEYRTDENRVLQIATCLPNARFPNRSAHTLDIYDLPIATPGQLYIYALRSPSLAVSTEQLIDQRSLLRLLLGRCRFCRLRGPACWDRTG